ncbi:DUF4245 domain-containing protein [Rothia uropygialis]|uniref:DUF4245 domain-containing protein n=1 Tax=Kocuria sp. 36 TaxID=1415402 RepID=UPI00101C8DCF|nr:DUF4245 domain-containing protein [Kocuria sp. 36]
MSESNNENPVDPSGQPSSGGDGTDGDELPVKPQLTESQAKRLNTPVRAMVFSMIALLLILLPFLWLVPRPDNQSYRPDVDLTKTAQEASETAGYAVVAPQLDDSWHANFARWNSGSADGVPFWEAGFVTPSQGFITVTQTDKANPTWISQKTDGAPATGKTDIDGVTWSTRVKQDKNGGNGTTAYVGDVNGTTLILSGDAERDEFKDLAHQSMESLKNGDATSPSPTSSAQNG